MTIRLSARMTSGAKAPLSRTISASTTLTGTDNGGVVGIDTTPATPIVITLPSAPAINDTYYLLDAKANWANKPVTLASAVFYGTTQAMTLDTAAALVTVTYRGSGVGWTLGTDNLNLDSAQLSLLMGTLAPSLNPTLTGVVNAAGASDVRVPTAPAGDNDTSAASTAFVTNAVMNARGKVTSRTVTTATVTLASTDLNKAVALDTTVNPILVTMPGAPAVGDTYYFLDAKSNWGSASVTLSTSVYFGTTDVFVLDSDSGIISATWRGGAVGWTLGTDDLTLDNTQLSNLLSTLVSKNNAVLTGVVNASDATSMLVPTAAPGSTDQSAVNAAYLNSTLTSWNGLPVSRIASAGYTVPAGDKFKYVVADTSSVSSYVVVLPASGQVVGDWYGFIDAKQSWGGVGVSFATALIQGVTQDAVLDNPGDIVKVQWMGAPLGWLMTTGEASMDAAVLNNLFAGKANLNSPAFTGNPTVPTPGAGDNSPSAVNSAFVTRAMNQMLTQVTNNIALPLSRTVSTSTSVVGTDKNKTIAVDTSAGAAVVLTLPTTGLIDGDQYGFLDAKNTWGATAPSFASATFFGLAQTIELDMGGGLVVATWRNSSIGWTLSNGAAMYDSTTLQTLFQSKADTAYVDAIAYAYANPAPEPLQLGPNPVNMPAQSGTPISASYAGKKRLLDWAGYPGKYFFRSGTMHITNVEFGTRTADTPSNTSLSAYVTDTEGGGAQPALFSPVLSAGTLTMAGGRVVQTSDGKIRLVQFADDALVVNCPRIQLWTAMIPPRKRYVHEFTFQVGDATTPCPAYDAGGKNNILVWQMKGSGSQPPIALNIRVMADATLRLDLNRKLTNGGTVFTAGTVLGLLPATAIKVKLEFSPDWQIEAEGGTAFLSLTVNDSPVELFDAGATSDGYSSISSPTVFSDLSSTYQVMVGMYRYDYAGVKAPNNCCIVIHKYILYRKSNT